MNEIDTEVFLALNGAHTSWLDPIMYWISDRDFWFPFYGIFVAWLIWKYRRKAPGIILTCVGTIALADQITSSILKPWVARLRPCHEARIERMVHVVWECGGSYGFASSHAANSFGFALTVFLLLGRENPWTKYLFLWAALVSYSRIYVGAHYPLDVLVGAIVGMLAAFFTTALYARIIERRLI
ncbi:MAG: phosphatase PAP2 family protein [Siphonobacter sp.]